MQEKILKIEKIEDNIEMIDIETDGNHLFYANNILTHNSSTDPGMENTSESFGINATADLLLAIICTEELEKLGQYLIKQLKNRYNSKTKNKRFAIGVDYDKMRLYDVEESAQASIGDSGQSSDSSFTPNSKSMNHLSSLTV